MNTKQVKKAIEKDRQKQQEYASMLEEAGYLEWLAYQKSKGFILSDSPRIWDKYVMCVVPGYVFPSLLYEHGAIRTNKLFCKEMMSFDNSLIKYGWKEVEYAEYCLKLVVYVDTDYIEEFQRRIEAHHGEIHRIEINTSYRKARIFLSFPNIESFDLPKAITHKEKNLYCDKDVLLVDKNKLEFFGGSGLYKGIPT